MNKILGKRMASWMLLAGVAALAGCAGPTGGGPLATSASPVYRCEQGLQFTVRFVNDTAVLKGARGDDVLLRDAGGQGAQTIYSNPRLRAEFGLGAGGRETVLQYLLQPSVIRCIRE
ncbi:hypothetical protein [Polaromonas sp. DSR2-3-2]|uniref:hypothetical protein n=1 Tax=unclassified Polaromonas TaxID=2638319 RepID=UPI003CE6E0A0